MTSYLLPSLPFYPLLVQDFTKHNTPRQNEHCLANFELSGYQQVFGDLVIQIYQQLVKCTQDLLLPLIGEGMRWSPGDDALVMLEL